MAKLGSDYTVDIEGTDNQGGGGTLPHMYARIQAEAIDLPDTKDGKGTQAAITFEVVEPEEFSGRKFWEYWTVVHADGFQNKAYKYGKPRLDRLVRATGNDPDEFSRDPDTDHLVFKTFVAEIGIQPGNAKNDGSGEFYKDKNQIERFFYEDASAKEPVPEPGVIGDGTGGKKAHAPVAANNNRQPAANQNRPAPAAAPAKAAGARPWGKK